MFQQQNQCQHRLNCVLSHVRQLLKSPMAATLLQEGIQESSLMATSSSLKVFRARHELPFAWVRGRIQSYETTEAQTPTASATAIISILQGEPTKSLWGSTEFHCQASPLPLAPQIWAVQYGARSQDTVLCGSCWLYKQCPQGEGGSGAHSSVRNPDWYRPNGIQHSAVRALWNGCCVT